MWKKNANHFVDYYILEAKQIERNRDKLIATNVS